MTRVLAIGHGRNLFEDTDSQLARLKDIAKEVESLDQIIFTNKKDGLKVKKVSDNFCVHPTNSSNKFTMVFDAIHIGVKIIKSKKIEVVTTQDPFESGLVGLRLKQKFGVQLQVQEHGDFFSDSYWRSESRLNVVRYKIGLFVLNRADNVRVVAKRIRKTLESKLRKPKDIRELSVAIDAAQYLPNKERAYPGAGETFELLSVARFVPQKNIPLMLGAFSIAYAQNSNLRLTLVGRGQQKDMIETYIKNNSLGDVVTVLDWSDDVPGLMQQAHAYVLSSNYEGWGRVLIEALANQLPIITTDVGCASEVVKNGEHGLVVPTDDVQNLAEALIDLSTDQTKYENVLQLLRGTAYKELPGTDIENYAKNWVKTLL